MTNSIWTAKWHRFRRLGRSDQSLVVRAAVALAVSRAQLSLVPFERLSAAAPSNAGEQLKNEDVKKLRRVGQAIKMAANNVPFRADCFPQALAGSKMLARRGYSSTIHLGVERGADDTLLGHAWLSCGDTIVTGADGLDRYTEIHNFGS